METDKIYGMKLHEVITPSNDDLTIQVLRVPGGWIYLFSQVNREIHPNGTCSETYLSNSAFVPFRE